MQIILRKEAKALGLPRYFTGQPCKHGHIAERSTSGGGCFDCRNQYQRENRQYFKDYWNKNKDRAKEIWTKHNEKKKHLWPEYYAKNREKIIAYQKKYRNDPSNKEKIRQAKRIYREENKSYLNALKAAYKANKKGSTPDWVNHDEIAKHYDKCKRLNNQAGYIKYHVDHVVPLKHKKICGLHVPWNLQVITAHENCSKRNKWEAN